jgi:HlyD family secretion protein
MKTSYFICLLVIALHACGKKPNTTSPLRENITESVYASGIVKSKNQYQVFASVSGITRQVYVTEGDTVKKGQPLFAIINESSALIRENAQLAAELADFNANAGRLEELSMQIDLAQQKLLNDSMMYTRQNQLWSQQIGSKIDLERAQLAYENAKTNYESARIRYRDEKRRLSITSRQAMKNVQLSKVTENDFIVRSNQDGRIYMVSKEVGEIVTPQQPIAVVGATNDFMIELQVDEYDIVQVKPGQSVAIIMDSYRGESFTGTITRVHPIMNERTKTFTVEAEFVNAPPALYPNLTMEANIIIQVKQDVLTLPRTYIINENYVVNENGDTIPVRIGIKDYQKAEILEGVKETDKLVQPVQ